MKLFGRREQKQPQLSLPLGYTKDGTLFALSGTDAEKHVWLQGVSGAGKSWALCWIILTLLRNRRNCIVIDPHGDLAELLLRYLIFSGFYKSEKAYERLWYIECRKAKTEAAIAYNILKQPYSPFDVASNFMSAVHRAFPSSSGSTTALDNLLLASSLLLSLNHEPITKLYDLVFSDTYRDRLLKTCDNEQITAFFAYKFPGDKVSSQVVDSTLRRLFLLSFSPVLKNMLSQKENKLDFRSLMQRQVSLIFNLGGLSEEDQKLLGCLLTVQIEQAFMSRADIPESERHFYSVLIDEFPVFAEQSGEAFNNDLEQIRKYKGSLLLINQHLEQLPRGIAGALQNAIPIMMKTGYRDSSTITQYFYRKEEPDSRNYFAKLFDPREQGAFSGIEQSTDARKQYETLERSEALISLHGQTYQITFPTLPHVDVPARVIEIIKQEYTKRLLTPVSHINAPVVVGGSDLLTSASPIQVARRMASITPIQKPAYPSLVDCDGTPDELLAIIGRYHYVTAAFVAKLLAAFVAKLLQKESSINNIRAKLKRLTDTGMLENQTLPKTTPAGKNPLIYYLSDKAVTYLQENTGLALPKSSLRQGMFLEHTLAVNSVLLVSELLPTVNPDFALLDLRHERTMKLTPFKLADKRFLIPDGYICYAYKGTEQIAIAYEVDNKGNENKERIQQKIVSYDAFLTSGLYQKQFARTSLTIAFVCVEGGDLRVKTLRNWAGEVLQDNLALAELFVFASVDLNSITPDTFFFSRSWSPVFASDQMALIEI